MNIKKFVLSLMMFCTVAFAAAQNTITVSKETTSIKGKKYYVHVVEKGQTLFSISRAYHVKYQDAVYDGDIDKISIGDKVYLPVNEILPPPEYKYYVIKKGNTLYSLSKEYDVSVEEIMKLNPRLQENTLKIGEVIKMPIPKNKNTEQPKAEPAKVSEPEHVKASEPAPAKASEPDNAKNSPKVAETPEQKTAPVAGIKKNEKKKTDGDVSQNTVKDKKIYEPIKQQKANKSTSSEQAGNTLACTEKPKTETQPAPQTSGRNSAAPAAREPASPKNGEKPKIYPEPQANLVPVNSSTENASAAKPKNTSGKTIKVSLLIPLYLDQIDEISTSKFDLEQRRKRNYKSFEFIQFYEGILLGLKSLESCGINVNLTVADVPGDLPEKVTHAFSEYNMAESDFIIALLEKKAFETAASLAKQNNIFIVNPLSTRSEIVNGNPYVIKISPSQESIVRNMLTMIGKNYKNPNVFVVHSNSKNEKPWLDAFQTQLQGQSSIKYTIFDWNANSKLAGMLKNDENNIVINIYDQDKNKNKTQSSLIMNKLFSVKKNPPVLISTSNWMNKYEDVDYSQLQRLNYHVFTQSYLDYANPKHKVFIDKFKEEYKTEPLNNYAALGNDIIVYFVTGVNLNGKEFWKKPNLPNQTAMLYQYSFSRSNENSGLENQVISFYRINSNYKLVPVKQ